MKPVPVSLAEVRRRSVKSRGFHSVRAGPIEFVKVNTDAWRWRDIYRWLLGLRWPQFAVFVGTLYIALNLLFAALTVSSKTVSLVPPVGIGFMIASFSVCKRWLPWATAICIR